MGGNGQRYRPEIIIELPTLLMTKRRRVVGRARLGAIDLIGCTHMVVGRGFTNSKFGEKLRRWSTINALGIEGYRGQEHTG